MTENAVPSQPTVPVSAQPVVPAVPPTPANAIPVPSANASIAQPGGSAIPTPSTVAQPQIPQSQPPVQLVNKNFWRYIFVFLVALPLLTGLGIFGYQVYLNTTAQDATTLAPSVTIDPRLVVTPDLLPTVGQSGDIPNSWKKFVQTALSYSFGHPGDWTTAQDGNTVILTNPTTSEQQVLFEAIAVEQSIIQSSALANFVTEQDRNSPLRINVATQSATTTASGLSVIMRSIALGSELNYVPEAYIALDRQVLHIFIDGAGSIDETVFNQIVRSVSAVSNQLTIGNEWNIYENSFGYTLRYPNTIILRSNDQNTDSSNVERSAHILLFPSSELQNPTGFGNSLELLLSDTEPGQSATQSGTRDFGTKEFKTYESTGYTNYVGQLYSGNWLQIGVKYNSNIEERNIINQVFETITIKEAAQP
jgi:hypothetical protein